MVSGNGQSNHFRWYLSFEFYVFLVAINDAFEQWPFLGNTEIVLGIGYGHVIALGRDAKENAH